MHTAIDDDEDDETLDDMWVIEHVLDVTVICVALQSLDVASSL